MRRSNLVVVTFIVKIAFADLRFSQLFYVPASFISSFCVFRSSRFSLLLCVSFLLSFAPVCFLLSYISLRFCVLLCVSLYVICLCLLPLSLYVCVVVFFFYLRLCRVISLCYVPCLQVPCPFCSACVPLLVLVIGLCRSSSLHVCLSLGLCHFSVYFPCLLSSVLHGWSSYSPLSVGVVVSVSPCPRCVFALFDDYIFVRCRLQSRLQSLSVPYLLFAGLCPCHLFVLCFWLGELDGDIARRVFSVLSFCLERWKEACFGKTCFSCSKSSVKIF